MKTVSTRWFCIPLLLLFAFATLSSSPRLKASHQTATSASTLSTTRVSAHTSQRGNRSPGIDSPNRALLESYGELPLTFEPNQGQTDPEVKFSSRGDGYTLFLTPSESVLVLGGRLHRRDPDPRSRSIGTDHRIALRMRLVGTNPSAQLSGLEELPSKSNYFLGNAPQRWRNNLPNYAKVKYESIYRRVDLLYYGSHKQLEYDFVVAPGCLPSVINLEFTGAEKIALDADGDLLVRVGGSEVRMKKPLIYQTVDGLRRTVPGGYVLRPHHQVGFQAGSFDSTRPLIIDPVLVYSTYLAGTSFDSATGIAVDSTGNAYVTGETSSFDFPTMNPIQAAFAGGGEDVFVAKLNPSGTALIYSTYVGGGASDFAGGIAVDSGGSAYIVGTTTSLDFPTHNPIQAAGGGGTCGTAPNTFTCGDAFIAKLNSTGSALIYSTYLGGSGDENGDGITVDSAGNAYVVGRTSSLNFPTANAVQSLAGTGTCGTAPNTFACSDAFISKLNAAGSALVYSTYLGGNGDESGNAIAVDSSGSAYVTGMTSSQNFPTSHPLQAALSGPSDAFVAKLSAAGSTVLYSTYLGGIGDDNGNGIAVDSSGNAYVTGGTGSHDFMTVNPYQAAFGGGPSDVFFVKLNPAGSALLYSTYLGGAQNDAGAAIALDASGNAYLTGNMDSGAFVMVNPFQKVCGGCQRTGPDAFVAEIDTTKSGAASLIFSSFIGGTARDSGAGIAIDTSANIYVAGQAGAAFPVTPGAFQTAQPLNSGAFVMKISPNSNPGLTVTAAALAFGSVNVGVVSRSQSFILGNAGSATLNISSIGISGANSSEFTQTNNCGISLPGGTNCMVTATFSPTSAGAKVGAVSISTNAAGSPHSVGLSGTAVAAADFAISAQPASVSITAGQTANYTITLTPANGFTGTVALACSGTPTLSNCSLPASATITGANAVNAGVSVTTTAHTLVFPRRVPERNLRPPQLRLWLQLFVALMLAAILSQLATKSRSLPRSYAYLGAAILVVMFWASGCGGGSGSGGGGGGTPTGTYTLTFTGTSGALRHSTSVTLTVN